MSRVAPRTEAKGRFHTDGVIRIQVFVLVGVMGAGPASGQTWRVTPSIGVAETLTDNVDLAPGGLKRADLITQVTPGISVEHTGGRVKANLNYRMSGLLYARSSGRDEIQNYLDASATAEAVSNWLFIDARAGITQQPISAFGAQPLGTNENINTNRAETLTYRLSPYIKGQLGSTADYQLRYSTTGTSTRGNRLTNAQVEDWLGTLKSVTNAAGFGWALDATRQTLRSDVIRNAETTALRGSLIYQFDPQLRATALGGWETNNYSAAGTQSAATYGARMEWMPTDRTVASAQK